MSSTHSRASSGSSLDSLFSERSWGEAVDEIPISTSETPPIEGLYIFRDLISPELAQRVIEGISKDGYFNTNRDQVMLFTGPPSIKDLDPSSNSLSGYLIEIVDHLKAALSSRLARATWTTAFDQPLARQVIINLYPPGEGIAPHVDLVNRYADGVVGVSLFGSATMTFCRTTSPRTGEHHAVEREADSSDSERYDVPLPPRSVYVLTGAARYDYTHGIEGREVDLVLRDNGRMESVVRGSRMSVTFRWMKEGGDVLS